MYQAIGALCVLFFNKAGHYMNSTDPNATQSNTGGWCWVEKQDTAWETILWELAGGKFIELVSTIVICPVMYFLTLRNLAEIRASSRSVADSEVAPSKQSNSRITEFGRKLHVVPVIFLFARIWGTINEIVLVTSDQPVDFLQYATALFDPSQGFFNGVMYVKITTTTYASNK